MCGLSPWFLRSRLYTGRERSLARALMRSPVSEKLGILYSEYAGDISHYPGIKQRSEGGSLLTHRAIVSLRPKQPVHEYDRRP